MMDKLRLICNNVFDIPNRVKSIDSDYRIFYNVKSCKFELHNMRYKPTYQLELPFEQLDYRVINYIYATRIDNIINEIENIDDFNQTLENKYINATCDEMSSKVKSLFNYLDKGGSEIPSYSSL